MANFRADTGYAWDFIEDLFSGVAEGLAGRGVRTWVAYPEVTAPPRRLSDSATAVQLDVRFNRVGALRNVLSFVRKQNIGTLYLVDRPIWSPAYLFLRLAGVRRIIVHDHTSGARTVPHGLKRVLKSLRTRVPGMLADKVVAVSDFVAKRVTSVDLMPEARVRRIWNSVVLPELPLRARERLLDILKVAPERPLIGCACRASAVKGVTHLLRAFDRVASEQLPLRPVLVFLGDGPEMADLERVRSTLRHADDVRFLGYREDAAELLAGADVCVVPSVWDEAFGLAALEPMARGVPVIASRVGGIPEVVVDGKTGLLVPPADDVALAAALRSLLNDSVKRHELAEGGLERARAHFTRGGQLRELLSVVGKEMS